MNVTAILRAALCAAFAARVLAGEAAGAEPALVPSWPAQVAASVTVQVVEENAAARRFEWESTHFRVGADLRLPLGVVRDLVAVFEATREALIAVPLGLQLGGEREKFRTRLFSDAASYQAAGGAVATGGYFDGREMLILLPNLGIKPGTNGLTTEHTKNLFVLKHEVTHQILGGWARALPVWLNEGFAECVASWPYSSGRYTLQGLDAAMHDYLLKWRRTSDRRALRLIAPPTLMALSGRDWQSRVATQAAYDHYNSAALLTYYFLRHDGRGDGAGLASYFAALRGGAPPEEAEAQHLLRGRTREQLTAELQKLARRLGLEIIVE